MRLRLTPAQKSAVASVMMKEGMLRSSVARPLIRPIASARSSASTKRHEDIDVMVHPERRHHQRAERIDRGDREVELAGDHQDRDAEADNAELDRARQDRAGRGRGEELG